MALTTGILRWCSLVAAVLLVWQIATVQPGTRALWRLALVNALQGNVGVGLAGTNSANFDTAPPEPGDIILGHNAGTSWGYWSHASLYVGGGQVLETLLRNGVHLQSVQRYTRAYRGAAILRVNAPAALKARAVTIARSHLGKPYNLLARRSEDRWFYCAKMAWYAYAQAGLDLDPDGGYWVTPDDLARHPLTEVIPDPH